MMANKKPLVSLIFITTYYQRESCLPEKIRLVFLHIDPARTYLKRRHVPTRWDLPKNRWPSMTCQEVSEEIQEAVNELMEALPEEEAPERLGNAVTRAPRFVVSEKWWDFAMMISHQIFGTWIHIIFREIQILYVRLFLWLFN